MKYQRLVTPADVVTLDRPSVVFVFELESDRVKLLSNLGADADLQRLSTWLGSRPDLHAALRECLDLLENE